MSIAHSTHSMDSMDTHTAHRGAAHEYTQAHSRDTETNTAYM